MIFKAPSWVPPLHGPIADSVTAGEFVLGGALALPDTIHPKDPFICALSGKVWTTSQVQQRVDRLASALSKRLGWRPNKGTPFEKVAGIFSVNTIDYVILTWAVHRLGGLCLLLHATSSAAEVATHLRRVKCHAMFTCEPLLSIFDEACKLSDSASAPVYLLDTVDQLLSPGHSPSNLVTADHLIQEANTEDTLEELQLAPGEGAHRIAYLCPTSGTSGVQKLAKISHAGLIANICQSISYESFTHAGKTEVGLGFLPFSHIYGLCLAHMMLYRGDCMVIHPQFDLQAILKSIAQYRIERLYLVPPVVAALTRYSALLEMFDLSSVTTVVLGAAALGTALTEALQKLRHAWIILPGWGLTEGGGVSTVTSAHDRMLGSSGSLLPRTEVRLLDAQGEEVDSYNVSGEIHLKSPSNILGYLDDDSTSEDMFTPDGWLRTGDVGFFRPSSQGPEHLFVTDRLKDLIKVKGMQVAPAEMENHLLLHPYVGDVAVVAVEDSVTGERPKAFIVLSKEGRNAALSEDDLRGSINGHVEAHLSQAHWLGKHVEVIEEIPKSASGKILRRLLKDRESNGLGHS